MAIHDMAARGFKEAAETYEKGRPGYPADAVACLAGELGMGPGTTVVDLAAGTGKLTRLLVRTGARVIAVEPVAGMRAQFARALPGVPVHEGTAEAIPVADGAVDAVTVGQAFHWFATETALKEIHRVLRPGGRLGLIWNLRDAGVEWVARLGEIMERHEGDAPSYRSGRWRLAFAETSLFAEARERSFRHEQIMDRETALARVASVSYIAALPPEEREQLLEEVRQLLDTHPQTRGRDAVALPYRTDVYWTGRVGGIDGCDGNSALDREGMPR